MYYRGAHAAFIVYDIRCWISFQIAKMSVEKLRKEVNVAINLTNDSIIYYEISILNQFCLVKKTSASLVIFLAGNKADCTEERAVPYRDAEKYARENGLLFAETSAKLGMNVTEMFLAVGKTISQFVQMAFG